MGDSHTKINQLPVSSQTSARGLRPKLPYDRYFFSSSTTSSGSGNLSLRGGPFLTPVQSSTPGKRPRKAKLIGNPPPSLHNHLVTAAETGASSPRNHAPAPDPGPHSLLPSGRSSVTSKLPLRGLAGFTLTGSCGASRRSAWLRAAALRP